MLLLLVIAAILAILSIGYFLIERSEVPEAVRVFQCPRCGRVYNEERAPRKCPFCRATITYREHRPPKTMSSAQMLAMIFFFTSVVALWLVLTNKI